MFYKGGAYEVGISLAQAECKTAYELIVSMYRKGEPHLLICNHQRYKLNRSEMNAKGQTRLKMASATVEPKSLEKV